MNLSNTLSPLLETQKLQFLYLYPSPFIPFYYILYILLYIIFIPFSIFSLFHAYVFLVVGFNVNNSYFLDNFFVNETTEVMMMFINDNGYST